MKKKLDSRSDIRNFQINLLYNHIIGNIKLPNRFFYKRQNSGQYGMYCGLCHIGHGCYTFPIHSPVGRVTTKTTEYIFKINTEFLKKYIKYISLHEFEDSEES